MTGCASTSFFRFFPFSLITSIIVLISITACSGGDDGDDPDPNDAPTVSDIQVTLENPSDMMVGDTVTIADYTYSDTENDPEIASGSPVQWYRDGVAIFGATAATYALDFADIDTQLSVGITPEAVSGTATGTEVITEVVVNPRLPVYTTFQAADVVIGQSDFVSGDFNQGGIGFDAGSNTLSFPRGRLSVNQGVIYVGDQENERVLGFNAIPTSNNASADFVLGQPDFTSNGSGRAVDRLSKPRAVVIAENKLFLADAGNRRVLIWNTLPTDDTPADIVLGQPDFETGSTVCSATGMGRANSLAVANGKLVVTDNENRLLIWNTIPTTSTTPADIVLGQPDFDTCDSAPSSATNLRRPAGVWTDGTRIVVADRAANRVLIWNSFPTANQTQPDIVLGQSTFTKDTVNDDNQDDTEDAQPSTRTLNQPQGVYSNGTQLFVVDAGNNRVLIWDTFPTSNFAPANIVLGQDDFDRGAPNDTDQDGTGDGDPEVNTLSFPTAVYQSGRQLFVTDSGNHRILIFNGQ